jgi:hypothetical protein
MAVMTDPKISATRSATIWLELKGESARAEAARMLAETKERGDARAVEAWLQIIAALEAIEHRTLALAG